MLASCLLFAIMGAMVKTVARELPNETIVFLRSAIGFLALMPWLFRNGVPQLATQHLRWHLARGLAGLAAMYCFFFALAHLSLAEATLLNYSTPLFIPFIATLWLQERTSRTVWWAIAAGFAGIALILKPGVGLFTGVALIGLCAGLFAAMAMVNIRRLTHTEPTSRIVFYFSAIATAVSAVPLLWAWHTPSATLWLALAVMGVSGTAAQLFLTRAYAHAPAAHIGPFIYLTVIFAGGIGWWAWDERLDVLSLLGIATVCAAAIAAMRTHSPILLTPEAAVPVQIPKTG